MFIHNKVLLTSAVLLLTTILPTAVFSAPAGNTTMWQFEWHSDKSSATVPGIFVLLDDNDKWYDVWYTNPVITAYMYMSTTRTTFQGQTDTISNGDTCTLSGIIKDSTASGSYYCKSGDFGTLSAVITVGKAPNINQH